MKATTTAIVSVTALLTSWFIIQEVWLLLLLHIITPSIMACCFTQSAVLSWGLPKTNSGSGYGLLIFFGNSYFFLPTTVAQIIVVYNSKNSKMTVLNIISSIKMYNNNAVDECKYVLYFFIIKSYSSQSAVNINFITHWILFSSRISCYEMSLTYSWCNNIFIMIRLQIIASNVTRWWCNCVTLIYYFFLVEKENNKQGNKKGYGNCKTLGYVWIDGTGDTCWQIVCYHEIG